MAKPKSDSLLGERMNLQVNLILDSEKRSGSTVSLKFIIRVLAVGVPVILGIILVALVLGARSARQAMRFAEQEQKQLDPVYTSVVGLQQELQEYGQLVEALEGWKTSRTDWFELLRQLQKVVPPSIQLLRLTVNETIERAGNASLRTSGMYLKGKAVGDRTEDDVQLLDRALKEKPPFKELLSRVEVKRFEAAENVTEKNVRLFEIECILAQKTIYKPKPKSKPAPLE